MTSLSYQGRVGLQQRVLPDYRHGFIDRLAAACEGGLQVYAGEPATTEAILSEREPKRAQWVRAKNRDYFSGSLYLLRQPDLSDWMQAWDPSALILEATPRYLSNWRAARLARSQGRTVLGWGLGVPKLDRPLQSLVWRWFLGGFDALIAYSSVGAGQYRRAGVPPQRVFVAVNAVVDGPQTTPARTPAVDRPARLLFVGRLQARKRIDLLLRACAELPYEPGLTVVGDGPARADFERLAAELYPPARFTGALTGEALAQEFKQADLFVLPGTGGLAIQQAMAHGLPVIVAKGDGTQSDLVDGANGWQVSAGDQRALAEALREALADPHDLLRRGQASRERVEDEVNLDTMVASFLQALNQTERA